jgi:MFS family permease
VTQTAPELGRYLKPLGVVSSPRVASLACGLAGARWTLIAARAAQGFGGALVSAISLSLIVSLFVEEAERAKAMGFFGFVAAGGGALGLLLGGVLTDLLDWHWVFLVNIPLGIAVSALSLRLLPAAEGVGERKRLDVAGATLVTAALLLAVYATVNGNTAGWLFGQTLGLLAAAAAVLAAFFAVEARTSAPLVPLAILRRRNLAVANVVGVLWAAAMFAWFFLTALYLQLVLGYSPLDVGLAFLPANVIMAVFSLGFSARMVMRFGIKLPITAGLTLAAAGLVRPGRRGHARRAAEHDPARDRRRHGPQSRPARGNRRSGAERRRPGLGHRQHLLHDGRRPRARCPSERRQLSDRGPHHCRGDTRRSARGRIPRSIRRRRGIRCPCCTADGAVDARAVSRR